MNTVDLMLKLWPVVVGIVGLVGVVSVAFYRLNQHEAAIEKLKSIEDVIRDVFQEQDKTARARLYHNDGESIFVPRSACDKCRADCASQISDKMGTIQDSITEQRKAVMDLMAFMGRVDEHLRSQRNRTT